jgi:uncharacterized iron-regulated protein
MSHRLQCRQSSFVLSGLAAAAMLMVVGCASSSSNDGAAARRTALATAEPSPVVAWTGDARDLPLLDGRTGEPMSWPELVARVSAVDAVVIGELHNDAVGHAFQAAITGDAIAAAGGGVVALEMLERDEQAIVDDWMDRFIDAEQLATMTESENWAGEGSWAAWYQPILDAARENGGQVVAANAPRRYVRTARTDGFDRIAGLPAPRRGFVELPHADVDDEAYFGRFVDIMTGHMTQGEAGPDDAAMARLRNTFRSQRTWDATMGDSVARALGRGAPIVLLMVGQFHSDFEGATVLELRARRPGVRVLTISMQKRTGMAMDPEDAGRADIIVHTGIDP